MKVQDIDRYGRTVGRVYVGDVDVNAEMVKLGAAWFFWKYAKDQGLYALENRAKQNKAGLWSLPEAEQVPPWKWRKSNTAKSTNRSFGTLFGTFLFQHSHGKALRS